jgi:hypothetical protein
MDENSTRSAAIDVLEWRTIADMLAFVLSEKLGPLHETCSPDSCAVAFALQRHAEAS